MKFVIFCLSLISASVFSAEVSWVESNKINNLSAITCLPAQSYIMEQLKVINTQTDMKPEIRHWQNKNNEIVLSIYAIAHSSTCGNLDCSAILVQESKDSCELKEIHSIQVFLPVGFDEFNNIYIKNTKSCSVWNFSGQKLYIEEKSAICQ